MTKRADPELYIQTQLQNLLLGDVPPSTLCSDSSGEIEGDVVYVSGSLFTINHDIHVALNSCGFS